MHRHLISLWVAVLSFPAALHAAGSQNAQATMIGTTEPKVGWTTEPPERGTLTLVYSCLLTIFACTWTVLHLNVPGPSDSGWTRFARKTKWMAITILLPEFVFSKAVCELRLALKNLSGFDKMIHKKYRNGLECRIRLSNHQSIEIARKWRVKYSPVVLILYPLLGLPRPDQPNASNPTVTEEGESKHRRLCEYIEEFQQPYWQDSGHGGMSLFSNSQQDFPPQLASVREQKGSGVLGNGNGPIHHPRVHLGWQNWTLTHSYFANMGGLVYVEPETVSSDGIDYAVLTGTKLDRFTWFQQQHPLEGLILSEDDVADKSKADWFLRALAIFQISWLVLTVFARRASDLPLTQLELATFAFSLFAIMTYAVNWWKPKDVLRPVFLTGRGFRNDNDPDLVQSFFLRLKSPGRARDDFKFIRRRSRVDNDFVDMEGPCPLIFWLMAFAAFAFGGIHCLGWNFAFPSRVEAMIWKIASITSAVIPIMPLAISMVFNYMGTISESSLLPFLMNELGRLNGVPSAYIDLLVSPTFQNPSRDDCLLLSKSIGTSDLLYGSFQQESKGDIERENKRKCSTDASGVNFFLLQLSTFVEKWQDAKNGKNNAFTLEELIVAYRHMEDYYTKEIEALFVDYENSYVRTKAPPANGVLPNMTVVAYIMKDARGAFKDAMKRTEDTREWYERVSASLTITCGIMYITVRLIIIVLLFTSLREVPTGVYKRTTWTRFLPSFS